MKVDIADFAKMHCYINGMWHQGQSQSLMVMNPKSATEITRVAQASYEQVELAVSAATVAFQTWSSVNARERAEWLDKIADGVEQHKETLVAIQKLNSGKPEFEADMDVDDVISTFRYYADYIRKNAMQHLVSEQAEGFSIACSQEPVGVCALIMPWNFPMVTTSWKLAPALAAGCTVVLKPSEVTPLAEIALMNIIATTGLPQGVVNLVLGGGDVGEQLVNHPAINKISFTGSHKIGQHVMASAASRIANVTLELGGKSSLLVLDKPDILKAARLACEGAFFNAGQMCSATSRVLVLREHFESLKNAIVDLMSSMEVGPLINQQQFNKVAGFIEKVQQQNSGVEVIQVPSNQTGFHFPLTLLTNVKLSDCVWNEEIFGPVMCLYPVDSTEEAVELANNTEFGLVATVVTDDLDLASYVSSKLQAGTVWVNSPQIIFPQAAWGGFKQSSLGRELGPWGLSSYQEVKHTIVAS